MSASSTKRRQISVGLSVFLLAAYLGAYPYLMDRQMPAQTSPGVVVYSSAYRFNNLYCEQVGDVHEFYPGPTMWNRFFLPIDMVLDLITPSRAAAEPLRRANRRQP